MLYTASHSYTTDFFIRWHWKINRLYSVKRCRSHITTDNQSWCQVPIRDPRPICFLLDIFFRQLRVCYFIVPFLTRGRVCNVLLLLILASAVTIGLPSLTRGQVCLCHPFVSISPWSVSMYIKYLRKIFTLPVFDTVQGCIYNIYKASFSPGSVQQIMP
jgi:hypothetical protein